MILADKTIIITGASAGIGEATALLCAEAGANLVLAARRADKLKSVADKVQKKGGKACVLAGDVRDERYMEELVILATTTFGGLDAVFNNAGVLGDLGPAIDMATSTWDYVLETNLTSAFYAAKYQVPALRKSKNGSLLFTSSFVGPSTGMPGMAAYAAAKAGLVGLVRTLAVELGPENIRVNALLPGGTNTDMVQEFATSDEILAYANSLSALKRMAEPKEIARAACFLLSDDASYITGQAILADGGLTVNRS